MSYVRPTYDAADATWAVVKEYTYPDALSADASWVLGTQIFAEASLDFTAFAHLDFPLVATATLQLSFSASLTINIELSCETALTFVCAPELTIGYQITGQVTEMGIPVARTLRAYDAASGALVVEGSSDPSTGEYLLDLFDHGDDVFVLCLGSATYGPLTHGPVQPDRL